MIKKIIDQINEYLQSVKQQNSEQKNRELLDEIIRSYSKSEQTTVSNSLDSVRITILKYDEIDSRYLKNIKSVLDSNYTEMEEHVNIKKILEILHEGIMQGDKEEKILCQNIFHNIKNKLIKEKHARQTNERPHTSTIKGESSISLGAPISISVGADIQENEKTPLYTVYYGTNRESIDTNDISQGYGNERSDELYTGKCEILIPESHKRGEIEGSWWDRKLKFITFGALGTSHDLKLQNIQQYENNTDIWNELNALFDEIEGEKQALIFIHGFNNSFEDSAIRAAQLGFDLKSKITAFFSWPSKDKLKKYNADEATIQASEKFLKEFLVDFVNKSGATRVNLIAHSMGNRGLLRAIENIQKDTPDVKFGQIILAAPDVDADVFEDIASAYTVVSNRTTLYVSPSDKAVSASAIVHDYNRAGLTPPVTIVGNINTIEVDLDVDLLELGHGYFAESGLLLDDITDLLEMNLPPEERLRLEKMHTEEKEQYWLLTE